MIASAILEDQGALVTCVSDGEQALKTLHQAQGFDVILMDIQMPKMDDYQANQKTHQFQSISHIPIIAMTANALAN